MGRQPLGRGLPLILVLSKMRALFKGAFHFRAGYMVSPLLEDKGIPKVTLSVSATNVLLKFSARGKMLKGA
eukprot:2884655-Amphidinium_carterae.1